MLIHNTWRLSIVCAALLATPLNVLGDQTADPAADEATPREISFQAEIEPIFSRHCYGCHQGAKQLGSYMMTEFDQLVAGGESEQPAIVPGKPEESYLVELIKPVDGHAEMPDEPFPTLSQAEIELIEDAGLRPEPRMMCRPRGLATTRSIRPFTLEHPQSHRSMSRPMEACWP